MSKLKQLIGLQTSKLFASASMTLERQQFIEPTSAATAAAPAG